MSTRSETGLTKPGARSINRAVSKSRIAGDASYTPLGAAANLVLPSEDQVYEAARALTQASRPDPASCA